MKRLIWLAILLPLTADAGWNRDLCDDIGWTHPLCANLQVLQDQIDIAADELEILAGEQAVQNDRIDDLEVADDCTVGAFMAGGWLMDSNGDKTAYQWIWHWYGGIGYVILPSGVNHVYVPLAADGVSTTGVEGIPVFTGTCKTPPPNVVGNPAGTTPQDLRDWYRIESESRSYRHKLNVSNGVCSTTTFDGTAVSWNCTETP